MVKMVKVFKNGASQAVRLPKEFRFDEDEVCAERLGPAVLLFPKAKARDLTAYAIEHFDEDFMRERNQPKQVDKRKW